MVEQLISNPSFTIEREIQVKKVKKLLDNWREFTLVANSVLLWEKKFYPWIIIGVTTFIYMEIMYYNPSFLTSVGLICLTATLIDFLGPSLASFIWRTEDWSTAKEREFESVARNIATVITHVKQTWGLLQDLKATRPFMYFGITITCSLVLAVMGNSVSNLFILYCLSISFLLLPGLLHYGIVQEYYQIALQYLLTALRSLNSSFQKTKVQ